ncbi:MAG: hypothetical protein ABH872_00580 [Candidatus Omnitrophota bacterium]
MKLRKSQSILEYISVSIVFAVVGVAAFIAGIKGAADTYQGTTETYFSESTLMGKTLEDKVDQGQYKWPSNWAEHTDQFGGSVPQDQIINDPGENNGYTAGQARGELYEMPNWSR